MIFQHCYVMFRSWILLLIVYLIFLFCCVENLIVDVDAEQSNTLHQGLIANHCPLCNAHLIICQTVAFARGIQEMPPYFEVSGCHAFNDFLL